MSTQTNQRLVLDLLETGKIDTSEADWLLERIGNANGARPAAYRPSTPYHHGNKNKVVLEIDADEENLQMVVEKISEAIGCQQTPDQKTSLFERFSRRANSKPTAG